LIASSTGSAALRLRTVPTLAALLALAFALRFAWPDADPASRLSWSNEVYTDPAVMVHAARNKVLFGEWIRDYNHDYFFFPLMNWLTWIAYEIMGPGRRPTVLLAALAGTATVGAIAWGLSRSRGRRAALVGAALGAFCYWTTMYARIPVAENVVTMLLAFSCVLALGRSTRSRAAAGGLAVFATFFGKYHAVGFLPGLLLFVALRERSVRSLVPLLAGGTAVFVAWLFAFFLPQRAIILEHVARQSTGIHGPLPFAISLGDGFGEIFNTVRRSWLFYRLPVEAILGGLFAFWTLGNGPARRARLADGTAVWAFWFISMWLYYSALPYKGPRYYVLVAPALIACAAAQIDRMLEAPSFRLRPPRSWDEHVPLIVWLYSLFFGAIDSVKHYASILLEWAMVPPPRISQGLYDTTVRFFARIDTFYQNLAWALALATAGYLLVLWSPEIARRFPGGPREISHRTLHRLGVAAIGIAIVVGGAQWTTWAANRTTFIEEIQRALPSLIAEDAVVLGPLAPLLTQGTRLQALPYFGRPGERGLLEKYRVTHVAVCGPGDAKELRSRYPSLDGKLQMVQAWPLTTLFASTLEIQRVPAQVDGVPIHDYRPTIFEEAATACEEERWADAIAAFQRLRAAGGANTPEVLSLEAVACFKLDDLPRARTLLEEAIRRRPRDPLNYQNLGVIDLRQGRRADAVRNWMKALRLDPKNRDLENRIRELVR
jgi:tetratricopeptide (TPR) repeat protein